MEYTRDTNTVYIRVDKDESVISVIQEVCRRESVSSGYFHGIGACDRVVLSSYIPESKDFTDHIFTGMIDMISLMGNITMDNSGAPVLHSHGTFSYLNDSGNLTVTAGHIKDVRISYTGEIILNISAITIGRKFDPGIGIEVWKLS